jgi:hypothetical protein
LRTNADFLAVSARHRRNPRTSGAPVAAPTRPVSPPAYGGTPISVVAPVAPVASVVCNVLSTRYGERGLHGDLRRPASHLGQRE